MRRFVAGLLIVISALSLLLASTSLWTRRHVVNTGVFVSDTQQVLAEPAVRGRIAELVTTTVMTNPDVVSAVDEAVAALPPRLQQFRPTVRDGVQSLIATGVTRLLASDAVTGLTDAALTSAHNQLVAGQPVKFTLGQAKGLVPADRLGGLAGQALALVPNDIGFTVVTPADNPRLYNVIDLLKSVWWWLGLLSLATFVGALSVSRHRRGTLRAWAVTTVVFGVLVLLTLRLVRTPIVAAAKPENRAALSAAWGIVAGSLRAWTVWLVLLAALLAVLTLVWGHLGLVAGVRRGRRAVAEQVRSRQAASQAARAAAAEAAPGQPAGVVPADEPWHRRVAEDGRAFVAALELDRRAAVVGGFVRAHLRPARWAGIAVGAVVLLIWPSPTLSVLIVIAAVVALYLGALEWLLGRAPEAPEAAPVEVEVPAPRTETVPAGPVPAGALAASTDPPAPLVPTARPAADGAVPPRVPNPALNPEMLAGLGGRLDLLVRLGAARDAGVLTDDEFARQKDELLAL